MAVQARYDYQGVPKDVQENFLGNQLLYVGWDEHLMVCAPIALPVPPELAFSALRSEYLAPTFGTHPDWEEIDWSAAFWLLNGEPFEPNEEAGLAEQGIVHKSVLRLRTPGLNGIQGSGS